ncbi:MAG: hypothetical protein V4617_13300 [Gemmatimonadota bacterium]
MKKKSSGAVPDFSRKKPLPGGKPAAPGEQQHKPNPRQPQKPPAQAKNGGRRGT